MSSSKQKKPKAHHSSIIHRIHQRHDARHHPGEDRHPEQRPLLQEEHPDSESELETGTEEPRQGSSRWERLQEAADNAKHFTAGAVINATNSTSAAASVGASKVADYGNAALKQARNAVSYAGDTLARNQKRGLVFLCIILAAACFGEAIELYRERKVPSAITSCTTPDCVNVAHTILESLHPTYLDMDPCDNFENYVCGGFVKAVESPRNKSEVSQETIKLDELRRVIRNFLEQDEALNEKVRERGDVVDKARKAYQACQNMQKLQEYGLKPLKALTDEVKMLFASDRVAIRRSGYFQPSTNLKPIKEERLTLPYLYMLRMGVEAFVTFSVKPDAKDPEQQAIYISPAKRTGIMLTEVEAFDNHRLVREYENIIERLLSNFIESDTNRSMPFRQSFKADMPLRDLARGIVHLETRLNSIRPNDQDLQNATKSYNIMTYSEFNKLMPFLAVRSIIQDLAPAEYDGRAVTVSSPRYLKQLSTTLSATPTEVLQAFCIWSIIQTHSDRVEHEALQQWKQLSAKLGHKPFIQDDVRWLGCVDSVDEDLGWVLLSFLVQNRFSPQSKEFGHKVASDVRFALGSVSHRRDWMSKEEKLLFVNTTNEIDVEVAYPSRYPDVSSFDGLTEFYRNFIVSNDAYLDNRIASVRNKLALSWSQLVQPSQLALWQKSSALVEPYHDLSYGQIVLPTAAIQAPFFTSNGPSYLAFSTLGISAGYEMLRVATSKIDNGIFNGTSWTSWSYDTQDILKAKESCFRKQYGGYIIDGPDGNIHVNGDMFVQHSIADAGAARVAYEAWKELENHQPSLRLPGLERFNPGQLFWLSYGSSRCSKLSQQEMKRQATEATELPSLIRIKGTVANSREFRASFDCPIKEPRCELW